MTGKRDAPRKRAVALRYKAEQDAAPRVVAKGAGVLADRIIQAAAEHGVPIHADPDLVTLLSKLEVNQDIPEELYKAVAEVLAFVYRLNMRLGERRPR